MGAQSFYWFCHEVAQILQMTFLRQNWVCKRNFGVLKPFLVALFRSTFSHKTMGGGGAFIREGKLIRILKVSQ